MFSDGKDTHNGCKDTEVVFRPKNMDEEFCNVLMRAKDVLHFSWTFGGSSLVEFGYVSCLSCFGSLYQQPVVPAARACSGAMCGGAM